MSSFLWLSSFHYDRYFKDYVLHHMYTLSNHIEQTSASIVAKVRWFVVKPLASVPQSLYPWNDLALAQGPFPCCVCVSLSAQQGVIWG